MPEFRSQSFEEQLRGSLEALVERVCGQIETDVQELVGSLTSGARRRRHAAADARLAAERQLAESFTASLSQVCVEERRAGLAGFTRLLAAVRAFDSCSSLSQVLDVLVVSAGREAGRAVVLLVRGDRLQGWRASGFSEYHPDGGGRRLDLPLGEDHVLTQAIRARQPMATGPGAPAPPFTLLADERAGLAVPIEIAGEVVGVLYADTMGEAAGAAPAAWPEVLEVLARHAGRCLEGLTAARLASGRSGPAAGRSRPAGSPGYSRPSIRSGYGAAQKRPAGAD